jgi:nucleotide-binding universal stress UspA family protein
MWAYPPRRILVAVDFGEPSSAAVRLAGELARQFDAKLTAVHAESFEAPPYFTLEQVRTIERQRRSARREAGRYLEQHATKLAGMAVVPVVADGPAASGILAAARGQDLIVMGTHGRRGPSRWWAGSVAERVVREARAPVLVVRTAGASLAGVFKRIVVAGEAATHEAASRYARGLAERYGGTAEPGAAPEEGTLVVLGQPGATGPLLFSGETERLLRTCRRPLLFVPPI